MLVPPERSPAVPVMISSKSVSICNRTLARLDDSSRNRASWNLMPSYTKDLLNLTMLESTFNAEISASLCLICIRSDARRANSGKITIYWGVPFFDALVKKGKGTYSSLWRNAWQSYGASPAIWDHTMLPATRHRWARPSFVGILLTQRHEICSQETRYSTLLYGENPESLSHLALVWYRVVTDGQADRQTDKITIARTCLALRAVARKTSKPKIWTFDLRVLGC